MDRRTFMESIAAAGRRSSLPAASKRKDDAPRQVIFILGESVRADMLNCYRNTGLRTPHLDGFDCFGTGTPALAWDPDTCYDMRDYLSGLSSEDRLRSRPAATGNDPAWTAGICFAKRCTDRAVHFLQQHKGSEYMFCLCYDEPHNPSLCPVAHSELYRDFVFPRSPNAGE